jgi:hypothetical protein
MVSHSEMVADIEVRGEGKCKVTWKEFEELEELLSSKRAK